MERFNTENMTEFKKETLLDCLESTMERLIACGTSETSLAIHNEIATLQSFIDEIKENE